MEMTTLFLQLFVTFFVIGLFTFGGGYAMLSLIQTQVVTAHAWITESAFTDIVAISQMTPGPIGINCATYVGYNVVTAAGGSHLLGVLGSFTATLAVVLPSFLLVLMMARFYEVMRHNRIFEGVMAWLRPAVVDRRAPLPGGGSGKLPRLEKLAAVRRRPGGIVLLESRPHPVNCRWGRHRFSYLLDFSYLVTIY